MNENQKKLNSQAEFVGHSTDTAYSVIACNDTQSHNRGILTTMRLRTKSAMTRKGLTIVERIAVPFRHSAMTEQTVGWAYLPNKVKQAAFTLAEVLITLAIIGIVAALTIPTLMNNYQEKAEREQVRMVKYKLTQATSLMNTEGLIGPYSSTEDFVNELQKHLKITKVCDNTNLRACWPSDTISVPTSEATFTTTNVNTIKTGTDLKSLGLGTANTQTMGIVFADGTPMILTYSPVCTPLNMYTNYNYSFQDNKPVTNATTNCISAIFDINGTKGPNRIGKDVRTLNSLFGYQQLEAYAATDEECTQLKKQGLVKNCLYEYNNGEYKNQDTYAGAVKKCNDMKMHLPDMQTLANIAGAYYGRTDIEPLTTIAKTGSYTSGETTYDNFCKDFNWSYRATEGNIICYEGTSIPAASAALKSGTSITGGFWASSEVSSLRAYRRYIYSDNSNWGRNYRNNQDAPLCVGD